MFGIGTGELLLLLVIALVVLGPERMPKLARDLGRTMNDLRRTSDELRNEFVNADRTLSAERMLDAAAKVAAPADQPAAPPETPATPATPETSATQAAVVTEPDETAFDREARLAHDRLADPERAKRAAEEGWTVPTDEAGNSEH